MTLSEYLRLLRRHWATVLLLATLGTTVATAVSWLRTPTYTASSQLFVSANGAADVGQLTQGNTFVHQRVKSYTDLVTGPQVLQPVIARLGLDTTPAELARSVSATSPLDTVLIDITVTDASPARARDVANTVALQFPRLVARLEGPGGGAPSPVTVTVTRAAALPEAPSSPRRTLDVALGLLVGLGLGVGSAVLREHLDRTVRDAGHASTLTEVPVLASIPDDPEAARAPLTTADGFSPRAEAFRRLRTNVRFLAVDRPLTAVVVTGSVPAEGKTTTAANLAVALAQSGRPVLLVDADLRRPRIADVFGLPGGVGLTSVLLGDVALPDAVHRWRPDLPLEILTAGPPPPNPSELLSSDRMAQVVRQAVAAGRTLVVDSPPLLPVTDAAILTRLTDGAILVTRPGSTGAEQLAASAAALRTAGGRLLGTVLTRVTGRHDEHASRYGGYAPAAAPSRPSEPSVLSVPSVLSGPGATSAPSTAPSPSPVGGHLVPSARREASSASFARDVNS